MIAVVAVGPLAIGVTYFVRILCSCVSGNVGFGNLGVGDQGEELCEAAFDCASNASFEGARPCESVPRVVDREVAGDDGACNSTVCCRGVEASEGSDAIS